ncbi:hypothetical protein GCM10011452_02590 [Gemmobacter lanyuensis]|uniref:Calcium-binding protein n=1 Tax=Gemmobacter lanyuensis TaxID=1054497 RepID=A0A918IKU4_9RHOB|nr:calcium-binding protein [Gemmobacter lanyuensis]GGW21562.1 hypothetical protein GCM10011452_02590 [Gemmobacter lanyuensis]
MDYYTLLYMSLFVLLFGNELDWFTSSGSNSDDGADDPLYDRNAYSDRIDGTTGADDLSADAAENLAWFLDAGNDTLSGSIGNDFADGGAGDDNLHMLSGSDIVRAGDGNDTVDAGVGFDTVLGGTGDDSLVGNGGMDVLSGENGNDTVAGGSGADMISGGDGDDLLAGMSPEQSFVDDGALDGFDTLDGGAGNDTLMLGHGDRGTGGAGDDDFVLDQRDDSSAVTSVVDFGVGDSVALFYTPTFGSDGAEIAPEISVSPSEDGLAGQISFNGQVVAHVTGGQNLTADDISLIADPGR